MSDRLHNVFLNLHYLGAQSNVKLMLEKSDREGEPVAISGARGLTNVVYDKLLGLSNRAVQSWYFDPYKKSEVNPNFVTLNQLPNMYHSDIYAAGDWFFKTSYLRKGEEFQALINRRPYISHFITETLGMSEESLNWSDAIHSNDTYTSIIKQIKQYFNQKLFPIEPLQLPKRVDLTFHYFEYRTPDLQELATQTETIDGRSPFHLRTDYLSVHSAILLPVCYNRLSTITCEHEGQIGPGTYDPSFDLLQIPEGLYFRYVSYWRANDVVLGHYDPVEYEHSMVGVDDISPVIQQFNQTINERDFYFYIKASDCRAAITRLSGGKLRLEKLKLDANLLSSPEDITTRLHTSEMNHSTRRVSPEIPIPVNYLARLRGPNKSTIVQAIKNSGLPLRSRNFPLTQTKFPVLLSNGPSYLKNLISKYRSTTDPEYLTRRACLSTLQSPEKVNGRQWINPATGKHDKNWGAGRYTDKEESTKHLYFPYAHYFNLYTDVLLRQTTSKEVIQRSLKKIRKEFNTKGASRWQQICANLKHNYALQELKTIAETQFGFPKDSLDKIERRALCLQLSRLVYLKEKRAAKKVTRLQKKLREKLRHYSLPDVPCSNHQDESLDHHSNYKFSEMQNNEYFVVAKPDLSFQCFHVSILDWASNPENRMCRYVQSDHDRPVLPDGTGSAPVRGIFYYPLPLDRNFRIYVPQEDFRKIQKRVKRDKLQYFYLGESKIIPLGNCEGVFGVSNLHGQVPGEPVYPISFIREREVKPQQRTPEEEAPRENPLVREHLERIRTRRSEIASIQSDIMPQYNHYQDIAIRDDLTTEMLHERHPNSIAITEQEGQLRRESRELTIQEMRLRSQLYNPDWTPPAPSSPVSTGTTQVMVTPEQEESRDTEQPPRIPIQPQGAPPRGNRRFPRNRRLRLADPSSSDDEADGPDSPPQAPEEFDHEDTTDSDSDSEEEGSSTERSLPLSLSELETGTPQNNPDLDSIPENHPHPPVSPTHSDIGTPRELYFSDDD